MLRNKMNNKPKLRLRNLSIKNFRSYYGESDFPLQFSDSDKSPLTVVHAINGIGKTTLFNAMHWCMYGSEKRSKEAIEGIFNSTIINNLENDESDNMYVHLIIENDQNETVYDIKREVNIAKIGIAKDKVYNDILLAKVPRYVKAKTNIKYGYRDPDGDELIKISNEKQIEKLLENTFPRELSSFLFLDGELLDAFLGGNDVFIKNAIEHVSQLPILLNSKTVFDKFKSKLSTSSTSEKTKLKEKEETVKDNQEKISKMLGDIELDTKKAKDLEVEINHATERVIKYDKERVRELQGFIENNTNHIGTIEDNIRNNKEAIKSTLFGILDKTYMKNAYSITNDKFNQYIQNNLMPSKHKKETLQELIENNECICGTCFDKDPKALEKIQDMMNISFDSEIGNSIQKIMIETEDIVNETKKESLDEVNKRLDKLKNDITGYRIKKENLSIENNGHEDELDKIQDEDLEKIRDKKEEDEKKLNRLYSDISMAGLVVERRRNQNKTLEPEITKLQRLAIKSESLKNKYELATFISNVLLKSHEQLKREFVQKLTTKTEELFLKTAPQKEQFNGVTINEDTFQIKALRSINDEKEISRGQAHVLAISFLYAVRELMPRNDFLVIDSPLHNISGNERLEVVENTPSMHRNTQLTFLVTDTEYTAKSDSRRSSFMDVRQKCHELGFVDGEYEYDLFSEITDKESKSVKTSWRKFDD
jgi:DNA sulfur modification protein DndD